MPRNECSYRGLGTALFTVLVFFSFTVSEKRISEDFLWFNGSRCSVVKDDEAMDESHHETKMLNWSHKALLQVLNKSHSFD